MGVKVVGVEDAVGRALAYDVTVITKEYRGAYFRKGHVVKKEDVEILKSSGHYYVYVMTEEQEGIGKGLVHEDEAVMDLATFIAGEGTMVTAKAEGKAAIKASTKGIVKVATEALMKINSSGDFVVITRKSGTHVEEGDLIAIVDLIPLYVSEESMKRLKKGIENELPIVYVAPYRGFRVGVIVTGTEIYEGRVKDLASSVVREKVEKYGGVLADKALLPDDKGLIKRKVSEFAEKYDVVVVTGGMSVDPTDVTHVAIKEVADEVVAYGIPIKPNTMSMLAYVNGKPVVGVSSAIIYFREWNILDVLLPRIMAGERWSRSELAALGEGGLTDYYLRKSK